MSEVQNRDGLPLLREWAQSRLEAARKTRTELGPVVKQRKFKKRTLFFVGWGIQIVSLPLHHPQDTALFAVSFVFLAWGFVLMFRGTKDEVAVDMAKWEIEITSLGLQLGEGIAQQTIIEYEQAQKDK